MALLTNQAGVSANAFTAYIVVQSLRDRGKARTGIPHSGPGYCDPDDEILAERWARVIITKKLTSNGPPKFEVVFRNVAGRSPSDEDMSVTFTAECQDVNALMKHFKLSEMTHFHSA